MNLSIHPSFDQPIYTSTHSFTFLSNDQSINPSFYPSIHTSINPSIALTTVNLGADFLNSSK